MKRKDQAPPEVPPWARLGGFKASDWAEPGDFGLPAGQAETDAWLRWFAAVSAWYDGHGRGDEVLDLLRDMCRDVP